MIYERLSDVKPGKGGYLALQFSARGCARSMTSVDSPRFSALGAK